VNSVNENHSANCTQKPRFDAPRFHAKLLLKGLSDSGHSGIFTFAFYVHSSLIHCSFDLHKYFRFLNGEKEDAENRNLIILVRHACPIEWNFVLGYDFTFIIPVPRFLL